MDDNRPHRIHLLPMHSSPRPAARLADPQVVDDLLLYQLTRLHAAAGRIVVRYCEGGFGITRREWGILAMLAARGPLGSSDLARHAQLDRPRTSRALTALEGKRLVVRATADGDARQVRVALTPEGERLYRELFPVVARLNRQMLEVLSAPEVAQLDAMLARLHARVGELCQQEDPPHADRRHGGSVRRLRGAR
jgi:DNA-binding MarR family transcriptional regulator